MGSKSDKLKGRVKEAVGALTDNDRLKREGQAGSGGGGGEGSRGGGRGAGEGQSGAGRGEDQGRLRGTSTTMNKAGEVQVLSRLGVREDMDTVLIILILLIVLGGGGWGYARWRR
jgi:hypothetical protein